jgi:hypothetical protein
MDFLDPKKHKAHSRRLIIGYFLVGILIAMATTILLFYAYGFGLDKNGKVYQNGFLFVSSAPNPANIYINGHLANTTNARLILPAGQYVLQIEKSGYRTWQRAFNLEGGSVAHFDYPLLFPNNLTTKNITVLSNEPSIFTESPDRHWLMTTLPDNQTAFNEYDLTNIAKPPTIVQIPSNIISPSLTGTLTTELTKWSTDNRHLIIKVTSSKANSFNYILLDRQDPTQSVNLTTTLNLQPSYDIDFINNVYNEFYIHDTTNGTLYSSSIKTPTLTPLITDVLEYKSFGANLILYVTADKSPAGQVTVDLKDGTKTYLIRNLSSGPKYLLDLAQYSGNWYYAVGSSSEDRVYIIQNPEQALQDQPGLPLVPITILHISDPNFVSFSADTRFIAAESGSQFAVYDAENDKTYSYSLPDPIDSPQVHATWMDGARLVLVSKGKVTVFDYDSANLQQLQGAVADRLVAFDNGYKFSYVIAPNQDAATKDASWFSLTSTSLLVLP